VRGGKVEEGKRILGDYTSQLTQQHNIASNLEVEANTYGIWLSVTMKILLIHGANFTSERSENLSSSLSR
jgi:hypothetical protein